ncbi:MAG: hypothetical protein JWQ18_827 [Conexibacter sp.]|nr:hypothetical protein [Conexibacter sp.]
MPTRSVAVLLIAVALSLAGGAASATAAGPTTTLQSLTSTGTKADGSSSAVAVSDDGRWVAFRSSAANLRPAGAVASESVFLRDRARGTTQEVTAGPGGASPDQDGVPGFEMSGDGRFIVYYSDATNLADTPGDYQAFLWDRLTGQTRRISTNVVPGGTYYRAVDVAISDDGTTAAYTATNLDTGISDVYVVDVGTGAIKRVAEPSPGVRGDGSATSPALSGDGRWIAYSSGSTNLVAGDTNAKVDIFAENVATGGRERVSVRTDGGQTDLSSSGPAIDGDGCVVAFGSNATNLVTGADMTGVKDFVRNRCTGETEVVSVATNGTVGTASTSPAISLDGCVVAFRTTQIFTPPPANSAIALRDRCAGVTSRADISTGGDAGNGGASIGTPRLGGLRGRYVPFGSSSNNLDLGDPDTSSDAYLRDRADVNLPPHAVAQVSQSGARVSVDATGSNDPDGYALSGSVGFGDGTAEVASLAATHDYARGGIYTLTVTVTDADGATDRSYQAVTVPDPPPPATPALPGGGGGGAAAPPVLIDSGQLKLSGVRLDRSRFSVAPSKGKPGSGQGATLSATLSGGSATLTVAIDRSAAGRRSKGRCVKGAKKGTRCSVYTAVGSLAKSVKAGDVTVPISGRLSSGALHAGSYRMRISAKAADGRKSSTTTLAFTILTTKKAHR